LKVVPFFNATYGGPRSASCGRPAGTFGLALDWNQDNGASAPGSLARAAHDKIKYMAPLSQGVEHYEDQDI
jgi:hypothetical protein